MNMKKKKNKQNNVTDNVRDDRLELSGIIEEALPGTLFRVRCDGGLLALCTLSGKLRLNRIRLLPGDQVLIEVSPYDTSKGRVTWRQKAFDQE